MFKFDWLGITTGIGPSRWLTAKLLDQNKPAKAKPKKRTNRKIRLQAGDVIRESRIMYDHYGVYVGDLKVIHFTEGKVKKTSLHSFCRMPTKRISVMSFKPSLIRGINRKNCVERANKALGMSNYDLIRHNCEHFATWCRTNKPYSSQATTQGREYHFQHAAAGSLTSFLTKPFADEYGMKTKKEVKISQCV
ncbi:lecithin retinol acyltransferase family protein [Vreelandella neptunia]|uniref:Lecithin retinol acyltransferase family protein n=1 Tax=Vreelandella neptunia TaxID=115551 RepID=A0ABS9S161_9GAMM|nr:lecithin retinol acyltransferase family protein [Halomonas neptunia]MCH4809793.1 lecithin retinol acyltransferase family protein [Halomonas neptunia]